MRGLRSTIALLVVLIGLGAYIYFVTWKQPAQDSGSKLEKVFASVQADQIEELKVKAESGDVTTLKKTSGAWTVVAPMATAASEADASSVTSALSALEIERVVDENPTDVKDYGLETPRIEIDFKASDGKTSGRLLVGAKTPTGASCTPGATTRSGSSWSRSTRTRRSTSPRSICVTSRSSRSTATRSTAWRSRPAPHASRFSSRRPAASGS